jgi:four helix bundle protein
LGDSYRDLIVWQRAIQLTLDVYKLTASFPEYEKFGLTNQLRRASVSVASNIAEGYGKSTKGEYRLFIGHARGSNFEVATQLVIASGLGFAPLAALRNTEALCEEVGKMLVAIMKKLEA